MRDYGEEATLLHRLAEYLAQFDVLITYNGKSYDQPLLETRFRMARARHPFDRMQHLDLLFGARRLWKLRLESCRLVDLENRILGVEREGDLPGEMIPYVYFDFLRSQQAFQVVPIFHHNAIDILSLACLTAIVPLAFRSPEDADVRHGADLIGLARWLLQAERQDEALRLFRRAMEMGLPDDLLFRTMWDIGGDRAASGAARCGAGLLTELAAARNPYRVRALRGARQTLRASREELRDGAGDDAQCAGVRGYAGDPAPRGEAQGAVGQAAVAAVGAVDRRRRSDCSGSGGGWAGEPGNLEPDADQRLQNAGIAERAGSGLSDGAEAGDIERAVGIAPQRGRRDGG